MKSSDSKVRSQATLSVDLDNQWSYMKIHGDSGWDKYPSYLDKIVPRALSIFDDLHLKVTVFVVGKDAQQEKNHEVLRSIPLAGHEIGNHSFHHESWLHLYSQAQLENEFDLAEESIKNATGVLTKGFRGPGFSLSKEVLQVLHRRQYLFDASTLPTFIGPLARAFYFWKSDLGSQERDTRKKLFGSVRDGLRPLKPYFWEVDGARILEIPVTTFPIIRTPFHLSYIIYLSTFSKTIARTYWRSALQNCRLWGVSPSILLHPLDFLGGNEVRALEFFPGMNLPAERKVELLRDCLADLTTQFEISPLGQFSALISQNQKIPSVVSKFGTQ